MTEINLLQTRIKDRTFAWQRQVRTVLIFLAVILVLLGAGGGGLMFLTNQLTVEIQTVSADATKIQDQLNQDQKNIGDAKLFQAQVANIKTLLNNHVYLTPLFKEIGKMTYVKSQYVSINVSTTGKINLEGQVENYAGLAKLILGLSTSNQFKDVKLLSVNPGTGEVNGYAFSIELTAKPEIFFKQ